MHDEIIVSCPPEEAYLFTTFIVNQLEQPRYYLGNKLVVPAEVTVARSWKDSTYEFKALPGEKQFNEVVWAVYEQLREAA